MQQTELISLTCKRAVSRVQYSYFFDHKKTICSYDVFENFCETFKQVQRRGSYADSDDA